ncbi:MAG TPA: YfhO family protein, partial [Chitinophagaceae bacterium]|nr:YfhO family protein [Chitinophagaceae bacterium]
LLNKTISVQDHLISPTINTSYIHFLNDTELRQTLNSYPLIYFSDNLTPSQNYSPPADASVQILNFTNNSFSLKTSSQKHVMLNIFQQYHHGWQAKVDNKKTTIFKSNKAFMSIALPAGIHDVVFIFQPARLVKISIYISVFTILVILTSFIVQALKNKRRSL